MSDLLQQFRLHWRSDFAAMQGRTILLAVSGGMDSMVVAHLLRDSGIAFGVAHCNFGLRAAASDMDEALVRDWCLQNGIQCHATRFDTKQRSAEWKKGTQETARILRYEWFESLKTEFGYARVATAHHANDNVETLLINLFRGTGIQGIHGIQPDNGTIIRPLLFATRQMVADYAAANSIMYREDESNKSDDYLRNAVRHHLIPAAENLFPNAVVNVNESIARFAGAEQLYNKAIEAERKNLIEQRGRDQYIAIRKLRHRQPLATIVYELLQPFGFAPAQLPNLLGLLTAETGKFVASSTHRVIRNRDFLIITTLATTETDFVQVDAVPAVVHAGLHTYSFAIADKPAEISADTNQAYIDLKSITLPLLLRKWRIGDYFYPLGMGMKKKKVSRLLIDARVPLHEKEHIWVLECNKRIVWVSGMRLDERFKIKPSTEKVLVVSIELPK